MNKSGPIIIIEDDIDDQEILTEIFKEHNYENEITFFNHGELAQEFLINTDTEPFIIFSDKNLPKLNAVELREKYACVLPGYHMNKQHWNTIVVDGSVSTSQLKEWIDHSYELVKASLPKKLRDKF